MTEITKITKLKIHNRSGKLYLHFSLNGKQQRKSLNMEDTKENRRIVDIVTIPNMMKRVYSGEFDKSSKIPTLDTYQVVSFENHKNNRKETTTKDYMGMYKKHIQPYFGTRKIDTIKVSEVNSWKNKLYDELGLSSKRVNEIKKVFGTIIQDAIEDEIIDRNVVRKSKSLPKHTTKEKDPFSLEEVQSILNNCEGQTKNIFSVLFFTGMRTGEMIGLKWSDIDFKNKTIMIQRTIGRGIEGRPKTQSSIRTIPILNALIEPLRNQFKITGDKNSYVFLNKLNTHYFDSSKIRDRVWVNTLATAKVKYRTIYNTRHTFVSLNLSSGKNLLWVSQIIGHKNSNITLEHYSKYVPVVDNQDTIFDNMS